MESINELLVDMEKLGFARELCVEAGAMFSCPDHDDVIINLNECGLSELVSKILGLGSESLQEFSGEDELTQYVQEVLDHAKFECPFCTEIFREGNSSQC